MDQLPAVEGSNVTLICHAVAGPLHNVTWYFTNATNFTVEIGSTNTSTLDGFAINSETVMALNGELRPAQFSEYGSLTIFGVQYDDRGIYKCRVENCLGSNESSAIVAVQGMYTLCTSMYIAQLLVVVHICITYMYLILYVQWLLIQVMYTLICVYTYMYMLDNL